MLMLSGKKNKKKKSGKKKTKWFYGTVYGIS